MLNSNTNKRSAKSRFLSGKTITFLLTILFTTSLTSSRAQNTWTQKADFGGTAREGAVGFSIGSKGYIGTGFDSNGSAKKDFWEYDPAIDAWTQKANFGGTGRWFAVGFSIGSKGYLGTGYNFGKLYKDFWEYDPATNVWTQKADFGGTERELAIGFSTSDKGYIGTGSDAAGYTNDFWEYDPATDAWKQKANFAGTARSGAVGFSTSSKGYIGTGLSGTYPFYTYYNDFWEYNPVTDSWSQKAYFEGIARSGAVGFSIGCKGYIGTGIAYGGSYKNDFWEYDAITNYWTQKANFGGTARALAAGFSIGSKSYIGSGEDPGFKNDFWEYAAEIDNGLTVYADADGDGYGDAANSLSTTECTVPSGYVIDSSDCNDNNASIHPGACDGTNGVDDNCDEIIDNGFGTITYYADGDGDGYGNSNSHVNECSQPAGYVTDSTDCNDANASINPGAIDIAGNGIDDNCDGIIDGGNWIQKADFRGWGARYNAVGFSINNKGYIGTGYLYNDYNVYYGDFWEYDPVTNVWTQKANFGSIARAGAVGFSIGNKGYIGTGNYSDYHGSYYNKYSDFWQYDPATNIWTRKADFEGGERDEAVGFSIGNKGYIGTGNDATGSYKKDFWEYDPDVNTWTRKADFGGGARVSAVAFSIGNMGYVGTGASIDGNKKDFWEYDPVKDKWTQKADFAGTARVEAVGFSIGNKGYVGTGVDYWCGISVRDFWEYDPFADAWEEKDDFGGSERYGAVGFSIANEGYLGTGFSTCAWWGFYFVDFWQYSPDAVFCLTPYGGYSTNITSKSAMVAWYDSTTTTGYRIYYKVKNTSGWIKTHAKGTSNSKTLKGLSPNTIYVWQVAAKCDANLHSDFSQHFEFITLSQKESALQLASGFGFSIFPNPNNGKVTVEINTPQEESVTINILDLTGRKVYSETEGDVNGTWIKQLDLSHLSAGPYFIQLIHNGQGEMKKLMVQ